MHCFDDFRWELSSYFHCQCADQRGLEEGKVASCCRDRGGASDVVGVMVIITITVQEQHLVPPTSFWSPTTFQNRQSPSSHWIQTFMWLLFLALWNGMPLLCWERNLYWGSIDTDIWRNGSYRLPGICFEGCIWSKHRKVMRRLQT